MAQQQQNISLTAPAFQGINTEDSPLAQDITFASRANNAVLDEFGRVGARKGMVEYSDSLDLTNATDAPTYDATRVRIGQIAQAEGLDPVCVAQVEYSNVGVVVQTSEYMAKLDETELVILNHSADALTAIQAGSLTPAIVEFADKYYVFIEGQSALEVDSVAETAQLLKDQAGFLHPQDDSGALTNSDIKGDIACSAYGRLWVSGVDGDYQKIWYSDLRDARVWYDGKAVPTDSQNTGGGIEVAEYWPAGRDRIVGIEAHNNGLVVFGRNNIILYGNAVGDPAAIGGIFLQDTIEGLGLVSRDAVASMGSDLLFVDDTGVRSLGRSIQEQSVPIGDLTANVRTDIASKISSVSDLSSVSLSYWPSEGITVCNFEEADFAYVLDMRKPSSTGGLRITTWSEVKFDRSVSVELSGQSRVLLGGEMGGAVLRYGANVDYGDVPYTFSYESNPLSLGDPVRQKFPKRVDVSILSRDAATAATVKWGFNNTLNYSKALTVDALIPAYFSTAQFGVDGYGPAKPTVKRYRVNTKGSGELVSLGVEATIDGGVFSLQELNLQLLIGRIY